MTGVEKSGNSGAPKSGRKSHKAHMKITSKVAKNRMNGCSATSTEYLQRNNE